MSFSTISLTPRNKAQRTRKAGVLATALLCIVMLNAQAAKADPNALGPASGYNVYSLGDGYFQNTDVWGETAVGGNAVFTNYGLGTHLDSTYIGKTTTDIGGNATFSTSQSYVGNMAVGGTVTGSPNLQNGGTLTSGSQPINFAAAKTTLQQTSANYFGMATNGTTTFQFGGLTFAGTKAVNVFTVSAANLAAATSISFNVTQGSTVIVNVGDSGTTNYSFANGGYSYNGSTLQPNNDASQAPEVDGILFNLPYATVLGFNTVEGSILAPSAAVNFSNGHIDGSLVVGSLGTAGNPETGEVHSFLFNGAIAPTGTSAVPEPTSSAAFATGGLGLLGLTFKSRSRKTRRSKK